MASPFPFFRTFRWTRTWHGFRHAQALFCPGLGIWHLRESWRAPGCSSSIATEYYCQGRPIHVA